MARIDSAYDYYMSTYANQKPTRYDTHKKSELRKVYNKMVATNKEAPLYKILNVEEAKKFAIDIKESAKSIQNIVASLSSPADGFESSFQKKIATASDGDHLEVQYVGNGTSNGLPDEFDIRIQKLASPQSNQGNFLTDNELSFSPGEYSFDLTTGSSSYEFEYSVKKDDTNLDIINKLNDLINNSRLGIDSEIIKDEDNKASALRITSTSTGVNGKMPYLFTVTPTANSSSMDAMATLGIHNISEFAHNSEFYLDNEMYSSQSNNFTINDAFEFTFKKPHEEGKSTHIGFKSNVETISQNVNDLIESYNKLIKTAMARADSNATDRNKLLREMSSIAKMHKYNLEYIGLNVDDNGELSINKAVFTDAISSERSEETFDTLNKFKDSLSEKADEAAINPINYVSKVIVVYKNPGHNFNTPYITSVYSGMMLDQYA